MDFFTSGLKSVLGTASDENPTTGADTVDKLVNRLQSSTLLVDRRDACRALKALSRTYRVEVGVQGMDAFKQVLEIDKTDCEIIGLALETLCNITYHQTFPEEVDKHGPKTKIGEQFTEIFIKQPDNVGLILSFFEEFEFRVRWPALNLLTNLVANRPKDIQEIILVSPMGISKLMDLLSDSREVIRNNVLLLLIQLTKGNANIQKIVAFESGFDRIFDVILQEGGVDGGIVVEDCLLLMLNLLRGNISNQNFFKEGSYIQKLTPMFQIPSESVDDSLANWSPQKVSNIHCMIQVIRALVAPSAPVQLIAACQRIMKACGLLQALCDILMASGVPVDVLTETINTVAEVIRGNLDNQEFLSYFMAPSNPPRPAIVVLLMSMVNNDQPFVLRCAVLYCFECYLYKNQIGQAQLIQTLLPEGNEVPSLTTGQLLCGGLFSMDSLSNWFSAVALSHGLNDGTTQKEQLLSVLLATNIGSLPISLMQRCVMLLKQSKEIQCQLGILILLCKWTSYCTPVVKNFLSLDSSVSYLIAVLSSHENNDDLQELLLRNMCAFLIGLCVHFNDDSVINYTKEKLCNLIENRIGLERFQDSIGGISRHEIYSRTLKHPQPSAKSPSDLLLDHEFCRSLKALEGVVIKSVLDASSSNVNKDEVSTLSSVDSTLIAQYKDVIREQDAQIQKLNRTVETLFKEKSVLEVQVQEMKSTIDHLNDQNMVLRMAQTDLTSDKDKAQHHDEKQQDNKCDDNNSLNFETRLKEKIQELDELKKDQEDLLELIAHQDYQLNVYKEKLAELGHKIDSDASSSEHEIASQQESGN